jgi:hypothetical protein
MLPHESREFCQSTRTTTSDFAPKLRDDILLKPFMPAQLELINGKRLLTRLEELAKKKAEPL